MTRTKRGSPFRAALVFASLLSTSVVAAGPTAQLQNWKARSAAVRWNIARQFRPTSPNSDGLSIVTIAGASKSQLREWMANCPAPTLAELSGTWKGLNRGIGPAMLGFSQFAKQMSTGHDGGRGDNIAIHQLCPDEWKGPLSWRTITTEQLTLDRRGNYIVRAPHGRRPHRQAAVLDYGEAANPIGDPSRLLIDKVVKLNDRFLLGRAMLRLGPANITVSYFVLERVDG